MDCYGNILHEKGLSNSTQFLMEGISCVTPRKSLYLTNRFQVAVLLFSNRSQMTSKCGKDRKVAHEAQPVTQIYYFDLNYSVSMTANYFSNDFLYLVYD